MIKFTWKTNHRFDGLTFDNKAVIEGYIKMRDSKKVGKLRVHLQEMRPTRDKANWVDGYELYDIDKTGKITEVTSGSIFLHFDKKHRLDQTKKYCLTIYGKYLRFGMISRLGASVWIPDFKLMKLLEEKAK